MGRPVNAGSEKNDNIYEDAVEPGIQHINDGSRIISLHGDVNEHVVSNVIVHMLHLAHLNNNPIHLLISTYGGSVDEMFSLYDTIKLMQCPVYTVALGKVMSAGVLLLASGNKGSRLIGRSARIMMHPVSGGIMGNVFQIDSETAEMKRLHQLMIDSLIRETKMTFKAIDEIMKKGKDHYLTPEQAIKLGIVDKIIGDKND